MTLQEAIGRQEGFGQPKTLATLNHNPGNIIAGKFATAHGSNGAIHGYATFSDDATGWKALTALLSGSGYGSLTVEQAINKYCPPPTGDPLTKGNQPDAYLQNVCKWLGVTPDTPIRRLLG